MRRRSSRSSAATISSLDLVGSTGAVGWFPLGPRDVYRPAYPVSRTYFTNVNASNTVINATNITNVYNNPNVTNVTYVNQQVPGAVVAVPTTAFVQSQPVARAAVLNAPHERRSCAGHAVAAVAPMPVSVRGAAARASGRRYRSRSAGVREDRAAGRPR